MAADLVRLSEKLETCIPGKTPLSPKTSTPDWFSAESIARNLANALRSKDSIDNHGIIGGTSVPFSMTTLLKYSQTSADKTTEPVISRTSASAVFEILRVSANLCMDHDINRGRLLDAEFPQIVLSILRSYVALLEKTPASSTLPDPASILSLQDLKIVKTAFGFLLNAGLDYKPVQSALREMKTQQLVLSLASSIYPPGVWRIPSKIPQTELAEVWSWRSGIAAWSWRVLEVLAQSDNDVAWEATSLKSFTQSLNSFIPPFPSSTPPFASSDAQLRKALINTDVDTLQEYAVQIEALPSEDDDFRGKLITPINSSRNALNEPNTPLTQLLVFIERGEPPSYWNDESENERKGWGKTFGFCKGAIIRGIVNLAGEEAQVNVLWGQNDPLGGWFVQKMVHWIKDYPAAVEARRDEERDDLVICATLCLGNLARREARCVALVQPPVSLVPNLLNLLDPKMDLKLKHGVLGLLKHLSQPQRNRNYLGELGTIEAIIRSKVWDNAADLADVVQLSAIGIVKHLVTSHVWNALKLFVEPENNDGADSKGIDQILDLIRRTDSLAIRNEATRILVNLIKTLWIPPTPSSSPSVSHPPPFPPPFSAAAATSPTASPINNNRTPTTSSLVTVATTGVSGVDDSAVVSSLRKNAFGALTCEEVADALGEMIGRNVKYPVLLNEGIMALTLLASPAAGGM
ncbi:uncharacterized protein EI90DRAFT_3028678 [Cantharellus anzutake]|uniref:uncharacterized protein n=1 Tax=Cantharellus anzutake TaxID=1750568 RepID=UPI001905609E|nr:uncharacterized protein EI90DRAFT_3028678 [Cantharellus anzutake]KAF8344201.1 hypothetical protein EI90DRAFT_3028678 [Cantharellus anzutake]